MNIPSITALVPMKEHSERVPGKNLRSLCGRPLFHWILESLSRSRYIKGIIINTDSVEIANDVSKNYDVKIHMRPDFLLGDMMGMNPLIEYDIAHSSGEYYLQTHSTNPLLRTETIDQAIEMFFGQNICDSLFSVTQIQTRFYWPNGSAINHDPDKLIRTQDLRPLYEENSCIYIFPRTMFSFRKNRIGERPMMFLMDRFESVDIDYEFDFIMAEELMKKWLIQARQVK
jgi:CMP-N-acetylneuraminic acid synthetase